MEEYKDFQDFLDKKRPDFEKSVPALDEIHSWADFDKLLKTLRERKISSIGDDKVDALGFHAAQVRTGQISAEDAKVSAPMKELLKKLGPQAEKTTGKTKLFKEVSDEDAEINEAKDLAHLLMLLGKKMNVLAKKGLKEPLKAVLRDQKLLQAINEGHEPIAATSRMNGELTKTMAKKVLLEPGARPLAIKMDDGQLDENWFVTHYDAERSTVDLVRPHAEKPERKNRITCDALYVDTMSDPNPHEKSYYQ
jgi:hypothetical protein